MKNELQIGNVYKSQYGDEFLIVYQGFDGANEYFLGVSTKRNGNIRVCAFNCHGYPLPIQEWQTKLKTPE